MSEISADRGEGCGKPLRLAVPTLQPCLYLEHTLCPGKGCSPLLCCASGVLLSAGPVSHSFTHSSTQRYALCFYYVPGAVLDTGVELRTEFLPWL